MSVKYFSQMTSRMLCNAFCTIFSLGDAIPRGLVLPLALGIRTLLAGENCIFPLFNVVPNSSNHFQFSPSIVSPFLIPSVILPGFPFISS